MPTSLPRVITSKDLRLLRVHNGVAERLVGSGTWRRGARGVYLTCGDAPSPVDLVHLARAHVGAHLVVTGLLALALLDLPWLPPVTDVHVLVPPDLRRRGGALVRVTRASDYDQLMTWQRYGARMAYPDRAVADAASAQSTLRQARGVVLGAVARGAVTAADVRATLGASRRKGTAFVRRGLTDAERGCASPPEAELVDALVGRGVPFYVNPELWVGDVLLGRPDVWLVGRGVGGEVESQERHGDEQQVESTYDRHDRLTAPGLSLVHLSVARIRADVTAAAKRLLAEPAVREPAELRVVPRGPLLS